MFVFNLGSWVQCLFWCAVVVGSLATLGCVGLFF